MAEESECQLRRRRSSGNPSLPLHLELGYQINEGGPSQGTPSPSYFKVNPNSDAPSSSSALMDFKNKQQSFDIQIEECEEEEIIVDTDDEGEPEENGSENDRAITPTPVQDFAANVVYSEGPQAMDFLKVKQIENECYTDVSDADTEEEEE